MKHTEFTPMMGSTGTHSGSFPSSTHESQFAMNTTSLKAAPLAQQTTTTNSFSDYNDLDTLFNSVLRDPRLGRLRAHWDPQWRDTKEKMKRFVDPARLPMVGPLILWSRSYRANNSRKMLEKVQEGTNDNNMTQYNDILESMKNNLKINQAGITAKATAKTFFFFFPTGDELSAVVASKIATKSAEKGAEKAAQEKNIDDTPQYDANESFGFTKAFLQYLGMPRSEDPVYSTWEDSRIALKQFFGAQPHDDLWQMEPKGELKKRLEELEKQEGGYDPTALEVPFLLILWRIYDCWNDTYADSLTTKGHKEKLAQRNRLEDERLVLEMVSPIDPHVQKLFYKDTMVSEISRILREEQPFGYGKHTMFSFLEGKREGKQEKELKWMLDSFVEKMLKADLGWGYFSDPTVSGKQGQLLAVLFFERTEQDHLEPSEVLKSFSGMFKLRTDYRKISKRLNAGDTVMQHNLGTDDDDSNLPGIIHCYGCVDSPHGREALGILLRSQIDYTSVPTYAQEYTKETERIRFLESLGFKRRDFQNQGVPTEERLEAFDYIPAQRTRQSYHVPQNPQANFI